ncbi:adenylyl-sulfate kinase [Candidatus Uhrbacteria bacterium CG_4_9_14_3_um_filter_41_35]|uniref:Adenylyl-sulfate kinase n=1 Tax=Candidatus Uhrbacteria bacterium CG_4_9_14_3_um_filter_41_35 TaxID=1975034 RepID=A0A2M7XF68_9BACT|nr:MAG: adenylyl-sulfate kinase [Candidatus Uhrbacteria bacterium CG11_big_fil_rev_8_21_14_0_20_41_9]PJA46505.1 MAG: adenylyl-sulfate kinase [Candidatus Uhrbacteria bacterium CG_4_9_14_3_um_filter_41_35]
MNSVVILLTGLSGSGKSTLAKALHTELRERSVSAYQLDGDVLREHLCSDLNFSEIDRTENLRRAGAVAKILADSGQTVIASFIAPFEQARQNIRATVGADRFIEVHVDCPLEVCEARDIKGLYKRSRNGEIENFTGITSPYEKPQNPDIIVNTSEQSEEECLEIILGYILPRIL